jgi:uncharacterized repeat protein (TIGR03843 family)
LPTDDTLTSAGLTDDQACEVLAAGTLTIVGRLAAASNASFLASVDFEGVTLTCIYKPVAGERPLWDFPDGTLAGRELAARLVSEAGGWALVPPTVHRDGRFGPGICQRWIDVDTERPLVDVVDPASAEPGWIPVLQAEDHTGRPVLLVHADDVRLRDLAVLDVVINNADRKGGHVLPESVTREPAAADPAEDTSSGRLWGCDHGVTFHVDPKLRTVLWGWAGEPLRPRDVDALNQLAAALDSGLDTELAPLLTSRERRALRRRAEALLESGRMPVPDGSWRAVPWPAF